MSNPVLVGAASKVRSEGLVLIANKKSLTVQFRNQWMLLLMSIPFLVHLIIFRFGPLYGWVMAFQDYRVGEPFIHGATAAGGEEYLRGATTWVGFRHFKDLFIDPLFWSVLRNTLAMAAIKLVLGTFASVLIAILVNETRNRPFKRTVQTISYLPHFVSWVVAAHLVLEVLSPRGVVNEVLMGIGIIDTPILFMGKPELFWWIIGGSHVWKAAGFGAIIYLAAMTSIDPQLYEAADIDGASRLQRIWHITMPGIRAVFVILLIMNIGWLMEAGFEQQYLLQNGLVQQYSEVFTIYVLRWGITRFRYSFATAAGMFRSAVSIALVLAANGIAKRLNEETLL